MIIKLFTLRVEFLDDFEKNPQYEHTHCEQFQRLSLALHLIVALSPSDNVIYEFYI